MTDNRTIIEMKPETGDDGELRYTKARARGPAKKKAAPNWLLRILGTALGVAVFLCLIFFFVYVILPLIAIILLWFIIKSIYRSLIR